MWSNFHMHSHYCDGKGELIEYIQSGAKKEMASLGFSSHAPLPFECKWSMKEEQLDAYIKEINLLKKSIVNIEVYKGLEIDFIPGITSPNVFRTLLDYTIGSVHFTEKLPDGRYWEIDGSHDFFLEGLDKIFKNDIREAISRHFELIREMVNTDCPSIIGHLDKIKIQNIDNKFFNESDRWYKTEILKTIKDIELSGTIVEVNTRGLYRKKSLTTYPSPWVLEILNKKNIPITLSSDAHQPDEILNEFRETIHLLKRIGFKKVSVLKEGKWQKYAFNECGIIFS